MEYRNRTALITGASGGIGEQFARVFAARGADLILVARSEDKLVALAGELSSRHQIRAEVIPADLSIPGAADKVVAEADSRGLRVDILVNNAGFGTFGYLAKADPARIRDEVALNVGALTDFTTTYLHRMADAGEGAILNIASNAAFQPIPRMAVYAATKAYVLSLSEALWSEGRRVGVRVLAVCPGATDTEFFDVAGDGSAMKQRRTVEQVVDTALTALEAGKPSVVDGLINRIGAYGARFAPRRLVLAIAERTVS